MMIFLAGLAGVDRTLYEAAAVDGAKVRNRLVHVTLPALRPVFTILFTLAALRGLRAFVEVFLLTNGAPNGSTEVLMTLIYKLGFQQNKLGVAAAGSVVLFLATAALTIFVQTWRRRTARVDGLLSFPLTPFTDGASPQGTVALDVLREHLEQQLAARPGALFVACGTGELPVLSHSEYAESSVRLSTSSRMPYRCSPESAAVRPRLESSRPRPRSAARTRCSCFRRTSSRPQRRVSCGTSGMWRAALRCPSSSSSSSSSSTSGPPPGSPPRVRWRCSTSPRSSGSRTGSATSTGCSGAVSNGDGRLADRLLAEFYLPFAALRDQVPGYAVALVKAGARLSGLRMSGVRPPLVDPTAAHEAELASIITRGRTALREALAAA